jgi:hypothetical protein
MDWLLWVLVPLVILICFFEFSSVHKSLKHSDKNGSRKNKTDS